MSSSLIGALRVTLGIDTAAFEEGLGIAQKRLAAAGKTLQDVGNSMAAVGERLTLGVTAPLLAAGAAAVKGAQDQAQAMAQVNAALASMGPVAGKTADQLLAASDAMEMNSLFDGDQILSKVTANLLTFGNVAGEQFDRAQQAAVDLATRMGTDLQSAAVMVGKALNDPVQGIGALRKVGIQLSADQQQLIKSMVATGDVAGAQAIILGELERQFGGAAQAAADTSPWRKTQVAMGQAGDQIGVILLPVVQKLAEFLKGLAQSFSALSPETQTFIVGALAAAAALGPLLIGAGAIVSAVGALLPVFAPIVALIGSAGLAGALAAAATAAAPFIAAGAALAAAWALFGDKIGPVLSELGTKFQEVLGPKLTSLIATVQKILTDLWNGPFGTAIKAVIDVMGEFQAAYLSILGDALVRVLSAVVSIVEGTFNSVANAFRVVARLLTGDFAGAWQAMKDLVAGVMKSTLAAIEALAPGATAAVAALVRGIQEWIGNKLTAIWNTAKKMIQEVGDKFKWLWDVVVGHSYIPDMVDGIGANMARLDAVMVKPAIKAADATAKAFEGLKDDVSGILAELFPLQAELLSIMEKIDKLDQARAKGLLDQRTYETARGKLESQATGLRNEISGPPAAIAALEDVPLATVALGDLTDVLGQLPEAASTAQMAMEEYGRALGDNIMGGIRDVLTGRTSFRDMLKDLFGNFLYKLTTDALRSLETAAFGEGGLGGFLGGLLGGIFKGKAIGGPVLANQPYIVGEKRPELFVPSTAGRIEPNLNGMGRGGGGGNVYHFQGNLMTPEFWAQIQAGDQQAAIAGAKGGEARVFGRQSRQVSF